MPTAIRVQNLSKCYRLGETHEHTLSDQLVRLGRLMVGRRRADQRRPAEDFWALRDINLDIEEGEAVGIIGANGAGKSTLLKVLSRITPPTTGRARVRGRLSSLLEVGTGFHPELTGRENVFLNGAILGMRTQEVTRKFDEIVAFAGVEPFIDTPVKRYSSGMYVRLAFAVAAHLEPDVLVIDEVLAVGDAEFQKRCLGKMGDVAREGRTVIFVSHNMAAIRKLCSRAVWLREGRLKADGDPDSVIAQYLAAAVATVAQPKDFAPGTLYGLASNEPDPSGATLRAIRLVDSAGRPQNSAVTWQPLTLKVEFELSRSFRSFSPDLVISTPEGVPLVRTSLSPDHGTQLSLGPGRYCADCQFEQFPLAAGEYLITARLTVPRVEVIHRVESAARLTVLAADVFGSGLPPSSDRYLVATTHRWSCQQVVEGGA